MMDSISKAKISLDDKSNKVESKMGKEQLNQIYKDFRAKAVQETSKIYLNSMSKKGNDFEEVQL